MNSFLYCSNNHIPYLVLSLLYVLYHLLSDVWPPSPVVPNLCLRPPPTVLSDQLKYLFISTTSSLPNVFDLISN